VTEFFHCAPIPLRAGSVIEPGNWGRILRSSYLTGQNDGTTKIIFELAYEAMRLAVKPQAPSRLDCLFGCPTYEGAQAYKSAHGPASIIYRVSMLDDGSPTHLTSWSLWGLGNGTNLQQSEERIRSYWLGNPTENIEILVGGAVSVIERLP
jgi:hypothetical protein